MSAMIKILLSVVLLCQSLQAQGFAPIVKKLQYEQDYSFELNETQEYILQFSTTLERTLPARVTIRSTHNDIGYPLMVVARQQTQQLSWQLPLMLESDVGPVIFTNTSRTLCHDIYHPTGRSVEVTDSPIVSVSTFSPTAVNFSVRVDYQRDFFLESLVEYNFTITPSEPVYYYYNFSTNASHSDDSKSWNFETAIVEVNSESEVCMTVSIQNVTCPVFDTNQDITFRGYYETVKRKGGITIRKPDFPFGFYIVFVAKPDDTDCSATSAPHRSKTITLIVKPSISYREYLNAVMVTLASIGAFYFVFILGFFFCSRRGYIPREMSYVTSISKEEPTDPNLRVVEDAISLDEAEFDSLTDADDKSIRLAKSVIYLSDLARKDPRIHRFKSYLYLYNVLTVALFYGLPAIQLVITYQRLLNETGQQDLCYYNFLCSHRLGSISDFNHLFSNVGYVLFGILFLWITYRREITHKDLNFERQYGIPQHYGMFYAMAVALIMEGVLSGSYHICPSQVNFQFDSSFMYVMAVLCMVKLYQNRHPDINATAYATFGVLAIAILLGMIGILEGNLYFWTFFTVIHILTCFYLTIQIYYMGCWSLDRDVFRRVFRSCAMDFRSGFASPFIPVHRARMCLLIVGNLCNWALAGWGIYKHEADFAVYLLGVFMANTLLYFCFYIVMKLVNKERLNKLSMFFLTISTMCAISAMYFFLHKSISWSKTPAESREFNQECKLMRFYDFHDIWHFLSAIGMFFTFMVLLTLDDDLSHTHRTRIVVF